MFCYLRLRLGLTFLMMTCWLAAPAAGASTGTGTYTTLTLTWSSARPNTATATGFSASFRDPANPQGHPPALRRVSITDPAGTRIELAAAAKCAATDMQLEEQGESACPRRSKVGTGNVHTLPLGALPFTSQTAIFNTSDGSLQLIKFGNGGSAVARSVLHGTTLDTLVPTCLAGGQPPTACPFDQDFILSSEADTPALTPLGHGYVVTPRHCNASHRWQITTRFTFADGTIDTIKTPQPCTRARHRQRRRHHHKRRRHHHRRHQTACSDPDHDRDCDVSPS